MKISDPLLLDTCAVIYLSLASGMKPETVLALKNAAESNRLFVSPITAWEIVKSKKRDKIALTDDPLTFFSEFIENSNSSLCELNAEILIKSWLLPGQFHKDPMDRIIVATARQFDLTLVTSDRAILAYGQQGHVKTLAC